MRPETQGVPQYFNPATAANGPGGFTPASTYVNQGATPFEQNWFTNESSYEEDDETSPALLAKNGKPSPSRMKRSRSALEAARGFPVEEIDDEDAIPLLEELGISFSDIWAKTKLVLRPTLKEIDEHVVEDADLAGPIVFGLCLGGMLLLRGKVHFGYIYGFGVSSCVATYVVLNLMAPPESSIEFAHVVSFLGYCLLPVIVLAAFALIIKLTGTVGTLLAATCVFASTWTSTRLFETKLKARHQRFLIAYPVGLIYSTFVLITIF
uniref:Protein YIPF n=1 Tax=Aureoumbra lagunensis TaxID=44058 RepID=A0A7S3NNB3_9STRA|mmetsp:Transcript_2487/g.3357  ORF Transcript_2487/g.3357 Transcript_2487/m.3357 type:complete len:266 (-) Transcript_2487:380-1177(-)